MHIKSIIPEYKEKHIKERDLVADQSKEKVIISYQSLNIQREKNKSSTKNDKSNHITILNDNILKIKALKEKIMKMKNMPPLKLRKGSPKVKMKLNKRLRNDSKNQKHYQYNKSGKKFIVKCKNKEHQQFILKGIGRLIIPPQCVAVSNSIILPAIFNINHGLVKIEEDTNPLKINKSFISTEIMEGRNFDKMLNNFNFSLSNEKGVSLKKVQESLKLLTLRQQYEKSQRNGTYSIYTFTGVIIALTLVIVWLIRGYLKATKAISIIKMLPTIQDQANQSMKQVHSERDIPQITQQHNKERDNTILTKMALLINTKNKKIEDKNYYNERTHSL